MTTGSFNTDDYDKGLSVFKARPTLIIAALWLLAFMPVFVWHFGQLGSQDHLSHFPITILLIGFLIYQGLRGEIEFSFAWRPYGLILAAVSILTWMAACYFRSGLMGMVSAIVAFWAMVDLAGGRETRSALRPALILSGALLTLPFGLDRTMIIGLQKIASGIASAWLDLQGIANMTTGVVVRTPSQDFLVEEACSGVNSLFAALTIALFWVLHSHFKFLRAVAFLVAIVFWVLLVNAFRVWIIVFARLRFDNDLTSEPNHTILGLVTFSMVMLLAASTDWAFRFFLPLPFSYVKPAKPTAGRPAAAINPRRLVWVGALIAGVMLLVSTASLYRSTTQVAPGVIADASLMPVFPEGVLPEQVGPWTLRDVKRIERDPSDAFGMVSQTWTYHNGSFPLFISLDGPYDSWHDLGYCYGAIGWQLRDSQNINLATEAGQLPMTCAELNLYRGSGERSLLMFTSVDRTGSVVLPPSAHGTVWRNFSNRLRISGASMVAGGGDAVPPIFQVQMLIESDNELTPEERRSIDLLYDMMRRRIITMLRVPSAESGSVPSSLAANPGSEA